MHRFVAFLHSILFILMDLVIKIRLCLLLNSLNFNFRYCGGNSIIFQLHIWDSNKCWSQPVGYAFILTFSGKEFVEDKFSRQYRVHRRLNYFWFIAGSRWKHQHSLAGFGGIRVCNFPQQRIFHLRFRSRQWQIEFKSF